MEKERLGYLKLKKERLIQKYGKEAIISFLSIFVLVFLMAGSSLAIFTDLSAGTGHNTVTVGDLAVTFDDTSTGLGGEISLTEALPMSDTSGVLQTPYKFKITNTGDVKAIVSLNLKNDIDTITTCGCASSILNNSNVRYQLVDETNSITYGLYELTPGGQIGYLTLNVGSSITFSLNTWIKSDATGEIIGKHFHKKLVVSSSQETPKLLTELVIGDDESNVITSSITLTKAAVSSTYYANAPTSVSDYQTKVCDTTGDYYFLNYCSVCDSNNANYNLTTCTSGFNTYGSQEKYVAENGLYKVAGQDSKDTYFYRGSVSNNYVLFAGSTWKIVRINEDGTIRMIKAVSIGENQWYTDGSSYTYLGYTFLNNGETAESTAKATLGTWYSSNLATYDKFIATTTYCNDITQSTVGSNYIYSAPLVRRNNSLPTYSCPVGYTYYLQNGLLTSDEVLYAGVKYNIVNRSSFLRMNNYYTMSPYGTSNDTYAYMLTVTSDGRLDYATITSSYDTYPVINLVSTVKVIGTGSSNDPYIVTEM